VTVLLGLRNPPRSWTGTVGPSLPGFTIAPCVDSLLCYRSIRQLKSILQDNPNVYDFAIVVVLCEKDSHAISLHSQIVVIPLARARSITTPGCQAVYYADLLDRSEARPLSYVAQL
jgi:hypothetical protein